MNPQNTNQVPSMELPTPQVETTAALSEQQSVLPTTETGAAQALEQGASFPQPPTQSPDPATMQMLTQTSVPLATASPGTQPTTIGMPDIADDTDLIEKEWVIKAKQIVAKTQSDPNLQNKEINKVKADYLKKRYNKEINLGEE